MPFSRHKLKSGTSLAVLTYLPILPYLTLPFRVLWSRTRRAVYNLTDSLMTRADPNLRRVDIIGALRYRNRIIQGIKNTTRRQCLLSISCRALLVISVNPPYAYLRLRERGERVLSKLGRKFFILDYSSSFFFFFLIIIRANSFLEAKFHSELYTHRNHSNLTMLISLRLPSL